METKFKYARDNLCIQDELRQYSHFSFYILQLANHFRITAFANRKIDRDTHHSKLYVSRYTCKMRNVYSGSLQWSSLRYNRQSAVGTTKSMRLRERPVYSRHFPPHGKNVFAGAGHADYKRQFPKPWKTFIDEPRHSSLMTHDE